MFEISSILIPKWRLAVISIFGGTSIGLVLFFAPTFFALPPDRPGCDTPIRWSLGEIDERFPLSKKEFRKAAFQAENIWEKALGKDVLVFDSSATFRLKTTFDERQKMTYDGDDLEKTIEQYEKTSGSVKEQYESLQSQYQQQKFKYDASVQEFEKDLAAYEKEVAKWNKRGGAPTDVYEDLEKEQDSLNAQADKLESMRNDLNKLVGKINGLADRFNLETSRINAQIETFRDKYGESKPFIQGLYEPAENSITIFQFKDENDLRLVIAHEFGHALGIEEHVSDPASLMHYLMDQQDIMDPELSQQDIDAYDLACPATNFSKQTRLKQYLVLTPWKEMRPAGIRKIFE